MRHFKEYLWVYLVLAIAALAIHSYAAQIAHILISLLAMGILAVAAMQAGVTALQNYLIKQHPLQTYPLIRSLPPVETMQARLRKILWTGFVLLSLSFLGALFFMPKVLHALSFAKLVPLVLAWGLFATLLYGYHKSGWSSDMLTTRTIAGVLILGGAYTLTHLMLG